VTVISSLISDAFRESNILPLGKAPNASQTTEALRLYQQNIRALYGDNAGENLTDWPLGSFGIEDPTFVFPLSDDTVIRPPINQRLIATNTAAQTVYLPPYPQDGSRIAIADPYSRLATVPVTLDANGRTIEGAVNVTLNVNGTFDEWFYRADKGDWVKLTSLTEAGENPFPDDFDIFFICGLAMRLNPRYGRQMDPQTAAVFKSNRRQFIARYLQSRPLEIDDSLSWPFMSQQSYDSQRAFSSNQAFNRGWYGGA